MDKFKNIARLLVLGVCFVGAQGLAAGGGSALNDASEIDPDNITPAGMRVARWMTPQHA